MKIIKALITKQQKEGLTDELFAEIKLGISRMHWYRIKTGKTGITLKLLQRIIVIYPELKDEVSIFLTSNVAKATNKAGTK